MVVELELVTDLAPLLRSMKRVDSSLEDQLRRALVSVVNNIAEGSDQRGARRPAHYSMALGSAREAWSCVRLAVAFGYIESEQPYRARFDRVIGTLVKVLGAQRPKAVAVS